MIIMQKRSRVVSHAFVAVWATMIAVLSPCTVNAQDKKIYIGGQSFGAIRVKNFKWAITSKDTCSAQPSR
jgi:hypothetical protein